MSTDKESKTLGDQACSEITNHLRVHCGFCIPIEHQEAIACRMRDLFESSRQPEPPKPEGEDTARLNKAADYIRFQAECWSSTGDTRSLRQAMQSFVRAIDAARGVQPNVKERRPSEMVNLEPIFAKPESEPAAEQEKPECGDIDSPAHLQGPYLQPNPRMLLSEDGRFTCPYCLHSHSRGPVNGVDAYRCLSCGNSTKIPRAPSPAQEKPVAASVEEWETTGSDGVYGNVTDKLTGEKIFVYVDLRDCDRAVTAHNAALARHSAAKDREIERLTTEAHLSHQAATDNKDWFDSLVNDLADKLGCGRFPTAILDRVAALRQDKES